MRDDFQMWLNIQLLSVRLNTFFLKVHADVANTGCIFLSAPIRVDDRVALIHPVVTCSGFMNVQFLIIYRRYRAISNNLKINRHISLLSAIFEVRQKNAVCGTVFENHSDTWPSAQESNR